MILIGLSGRAESGKSTIAEYLVAEYGYKPVEMSLIIRAAFLAWRPKQVTTPDHVMHVWRDVALRNGLLYEKPTSPEVRASLQYFNDWSLEQDKKVWVRAIAKECRDGDPLRVVLGSMRMANEFDFVRAHRGHTWRVIRVGHRINGEVSKHITETALDGAPFDQYVANNGVIADLYKLVDVLVRGYLL